MAAQTKEQVQASLSGLCTKLLEPETPEAATLLRVAELVGCFETDRLDADSRRVFVRCSQCLELETSGELALALGHTMARLSALAYGGAREAFLHDGALGVLLRLCFSCQAESSPQLSHMYTLLSAARVLHLFCIQAALGNNQIG